MIEPVRYKSGYKYQLAEGFYIRTAIRPPADIVEPFICLSRNGGLYLSAGYAWDGATGCPDFKSVMRGSLVHDALYQLLRLKLIPEKERVTADLLLYDCCIEDGMWKPLAWSILQAVRVCGGPAADPANARPILVAP